MKFKINIISFIIISSYLLSSNLGVSMESKYGNGTKIHSETNENEGSYYYNENVLLSYYSVWLESNG